MLKRASERLRKVMEAQSEGSAGAQQITATSALEAAPAFHTRSLPPPTPPQASGAGAPAVGAVGPPLRRHTRTHSGNIPKVSAHTPTYYGRHPFSEPEMAVEPSAASDASNSSFYTAAEDGVESSGPSYADRPHRGVDRSSAGGPFQGDRPPRAERPSPLGADRGAQPPLPPIATGSNSRFTHHAQVGYAPACKLAAANSLLTVHLQKCMGGRPLGTWTADSEHDSDHRCWDLHSLHRALSQPS